MRFFVVLNRGAGAVIGRRLAELEADAQRWFDSAGLPATITAVSAESLPATLDRAAASAAEVVVVGGGDGTFALAAQRLMRSGKVLGLIPLGTMNLLARDLNIPSQPDAAVRALAKAEERSIDAAELNGRLFLHSSVLGLYAWLARVRERYRGRPRLIKWTALITALFKTLRSYKQVRVSLALDDGWRTLQVPMLCVANNELREAPLLLGQRERLDGGRLVVYAPKHRTPFGFLIFVLRLLFGNWAQDSRLDTLHTHRLVVVSRRDRVNVANDGEVVALMPPLRYRCIPKAIRVLVPRTPDMAWRTERHSGPGAPGQREIVSSAR